MTSSVKELGDGVSTSAVEDAAIAEIEMQRLGAPLAGHNPIRLP
jgi:hypothetical protein